MATLQQVRENLGRTWDQLSEGWRHLLDRASGALTKFSPVHHSSGKDADDYIPVSWQGIRWGLMAADVFDDDDRVVVKLEAPDMDANDFNIEVRGDMLVVRGEKKFSREQNRGQYHLLERAYGRFERAVALPCEVDDSKAKANYRRGILHITLPKVPGQRRRHIEVRSA